MSNQPSRDPELATRLQEVLQGEWPQRLAVLFGSAAADRQRDESDVDIAILPLESGWDAAVERDLYVALARTAGRDEYSSRTQQTQHAARSCRSGGAPVLRRSMFSSAWS